jgi:rare lipoprotein A
VERLRRKKVRRKVGGLAVASGVVAVTVLAVAVAGLDGGRGAAPEAAPAPVRLEMAGSALGSAEARSVVEGEAGLPSPAVELFFLRTTSRSTPREMGVWAVEGMSERMLNFLNAPTGDGSYVVTPAGFRPRHVVPASVVVKGKLHDVLTNADTVGELLSAMGIEPDGNDHVAPAAQAPLSTRSVRYVDVRVRKVVDARVVGFSVHVTTDDSLAPGERVVDRRGTAGLVHDVYKVRREDGRVVSRELVRSDVVKEPVSGIVRLGPEPVESEDGGSEPGGNVQYGEASWYEPPWGGLTAAHPWLPFGTVVTVTNLDNGKTVTVTINDRGPFGGRIIDLSEEAFAVIAPLGQGVARVKLTW